MFKVEQRYEFTAIFGKNLTLSKCQTPEIDIWCFTQLAMTFKHPLSSNNLQSLDFTITELRKCKQIHRKRDKFGKNEVKMCKNICDLSIHNRCNG